MKESLRHNRNSSNVICFKVAVNNQQSIAWEDENEFKLDNEMYDVIEKFVEGDQLVIRCIADKKEDFLLQQFRTKNEDSKPASKSMKLALVKVLTNFFEPVAPIQIAGAGIDKIIHHAHYFSYLRAINRTIITPPPQAA